MYEELFKRRSLSNIPMQRISTPIDEMYKRIMVSAVKPAKLKGRDSTSIHMLKRARDCDASDQQVKHRFWNCGEYDDKYLEVLKNKFTTENYKFTYKVAYSGNTPDDFIIKISWKHAKTCIIS